LAWVNGICGSGQIGAVKTTGVENAEVDISERCGKGGQCGSGNIGTMWQGWAMQEWTYHHGMARVNNAGSKVNVPVKLKM